MKYKRIKPNQYRGLLYLVVIDMTLCMILIFLRKWIKIKGLITITGLGGLLGIAIALWKRKAIRYAFLFNDFIMRQEIVQYTYDKNKKRIDYYPQMFFKEENGILYFKLRLDGSIISRKFRDLAQPLSDFFKMVLVESYEELGFITYGLEIGELKQEIYKSLSELPELEEHGRIKLGNREIPWLTAYHIILTGNTGSGKSEVAMMLMYLLKKQNVEVVYCDPKHDEKMKRFCDAYDIEYYSDQEEIARCVASLQKELILREGDLEKGGLSRAQFSIEKYLFFDELLAYSVVATGANYKIVSSAIASLVLAGRGKNLYVCLITQRADVGSKSILDGFTRDSIYTRIVMGQASTTAQEMVFGNEFAKVKNTHKEIGSGLIFRVGINSRPQELFVPFIHKK